MRSGFYSDFWLSGGVCRSLLWRDRDVEALDLDAEEGGELVHPAEVLDMGQWMRLGPQQNAEIVGEYVTALRRRRAALAAA